MLPQNHNVYDGRSQNQSESCVVVLKTIDATNSIASSLSAYSAQEQTLIAGHVSVDERLPSVLAEHPGTMTDNPVARASGIPAAGMRAGNASTCDRRPNRSQFV